MNKFQLAAIKRNNATIAVLDKKIKGIEDKVKSFIDKYEDELIQLKQEKADYEAINAKYLNDEEIGTTETVSPETVWANPESPVEFEEEPTALAFSGLN